MIVDSLPRLETEACRNAKPKFMYLAVNSLRNPLTNNRRSYPLRPNQGESISKARSPSGLPSYTPRRCRPGTKQLGGLQPAAAWSFKQLKSRGRIPGFTCGCQPIPLFRCLRILEKASVLLARVGFFGLLKFRSGLGPRLRAAEL